MQHSRKRTRTHSRSGARAKSGLASSSTATAGASGSEDAALFQNDAHMLRQCISSLFRAGSTMRTFRFASQKIEPNLATEQLWSQLDVLYAPSLKKLSTSVEEAKFENAEALNAMAKQQQRASSKKSKQQQRYTFDDDNGDDDGDDADAIAKTRSRLPRALREQLDEQEEREQLLKQRRADRAAGGSGGANGFFAFGKPSQGFREEDLSDFDEVGQDEERQERDGGFDNVDDDEDDFGGDGVEFGEDDDDLLLDDEAGGDADMDINEDEAAYREMYGDEAGDDDDVNAAFNKDEFADFFADEESQNGGDLSKKRLNFGDDDEDGGDDLDFGEDEDEELDEGVDLSTLTPFEIAERERQQRIRSAEQERIAGSWEMSGEVGAAQRPRDALLQTDLVMEHAMPSAPVVTDSMTSRLEDRLKRRILANHFDDVIRKNSKLVSLDDQSSAKVLRQDQLDAQGQKSKASLVDLYEKEYLEKQQRADAAGAANGGAGEAAQPMTALEQDELKALQQWRRISQHLDALSNFFFTPKPVGADLDARVRAVQDQAPAISVESKGMFALSKDKVLAPQDVFRPRGNLSTAVTSREEMSPGEKRGLRQAHKRSFQTSQALETRRKHQGERKKEQRKAAAGASADASAGAGEDAA